MPAASVRAASAAVSFLTRIPVGRAVVADAMDVARGVVLFPVVGAGIGLVTGGVAVGLDQFVSPLVAAGAAVAAASVVTGALHLDALADTADAIGATSREQALAVMRDSRIGSFGGAALVLDLLVKVAALAALLGAGHAVAAAVAAGALSRASSLPLAALLPYARAEGGPGSVLSGRVSGAAAAAGVAIASLATLLVWWPSGAWLLVAALATTAVLGLLFQRWLGGVTGDCLGATTELCETVVLVIAGALA
jgi:adenosylcobinamide-GDP ribazoletransferase